MPSFYTDTLNNLELASESSSCSSSEDYSPNKIKQKRSSNLSKLNASGSAKDNRIRMPYSAFNSKKPAVHPL